MSTTKLLIIIFLFSLTAFIQIKQFENIQIRIISLKNCTKNPGSVLVTINGPNLSNKMNESKNGSNLLAQMNGLNNGSNSLAQMNESINGSEILDDMNESKNGSNSLAQMNESINGSNLSEQMNGLNNVSDFLDEMNGLKNVSNFLNETNESNNVSEILDGLNDEIFQNSSLMTTMANMNVVEIESIFEIEVNGTINNVSNVLQLMDNYDNINKTGIESNNSDPTNMTTSGNQISSDTDDHENIIDDDYEIDTSIKNLHPKNYRKMSYAALFVMAGISLYLLYIYTKIVYEIQRVRYS